MRWQNHRSAEKYLSSVEAGALPVANEEPLGTDELFGERVAMGLRLVTGVDLEAVCRVYGVPWPQKEQRASALVERGLLVREASGRYRLTDVGFDVHSAVAAWLM